MGKIFTIKTPQDAIEFGDFDNETTEYTATIEDALVWEKDEEKTLFVIDTIGCFASQMNLINAVEKEYEHLLEEYRKN